MGLEGHDFRMIRLQVVSLCWQKDLEWLTQYSCVKSNNLILSYYLILPYFPADWIDVFVCFPRASISTKNEMAIL